MKVMVFTSTLAICVVAILKTPHKMWDNYTIVWSLLLKNLEYIRGFRDLGTCGTSPHADMAGNNVQATAWRDGTHVTGVVDVRVLRRKPTAFCWRVTCTLSSLGAVIPSFWKWWRLLSAIKGTPLLLVTPEWVSAAVMQNQWMSLGN